ncbi:hypothetical protein [Paenibacillus sp. FSL R10-2788]|uniref:hypothetical protein n=1 Tax=Paenibacillus sp. FSL R10-2788 TaxID=2954694 RepID=UPI0030F82B13
MKKEHITKNSCNIKTDKPDSDQPKTKQKPPYGYSISIVGAMDTYYYRTTDDGFNREESSDI